MGTHKLFIHMGTPKTGTSSLQEFLYENGTKLMKYGWSYPHLTESVLCPYPIANQYPEINGFALYFSFLSRKNSGQAVFDKLMAEIVSHLQHSHVIVSCESFWEIELESFFWEIRRFWDNIHAVVYLRRQDRFLESCWYEQVKLGMKRETKDLSSYVRMCEARGDANYLSKLDCLRGLLKDSFRVRIYEKKSLLEQDIISDFMSLIGIHRLDKQWKRLPRSNDRVSGDVLEIKRIFNEIAPICYSSEEYDDLFIKFDSLYHEKDSAEIYSKRLMPPELSREIMEAHQAENEEIARRYFARPDGVLFRDIAMVPNHVIPINEFERTMLRLLFFFIHEQGKIAWGKYIKHEKFKWGFLYGLDAIQKKKVVFFGAGKICRECLEIYPYRPQAILDNYVSEGHINGIPILPAQKIEDWEEYLIVITCADDRCIVAQLDRLGLQDDVHYMNYRDFFKLVEADNGW